MRKLSDLIKENTENKMYTFQATVKVSGSVHAPDVQEAGYYAEKQIDSIAEETELSIDDFVLTTLDEDESVQENVTNLSSEEEKANVAYNEILKSINDKTKNMSDYYRAMTFTKLGIDQKLVEGLSAKINEGTITNPDYDRLYKELVGDKGASDTLEGEMLRAISRIGYRYLNDGDYCFEDYGIETAGAAYAFLLNHSKKVEGLKEALESMTFSYEDRYLKFIQAAVDCIVTYILGKNGEYEKNTEDMFDYNKEAIDMFGSPYDQHAEDENDEIDESKN